MDEDRGRRNKEKLGHEMPTSFSFEKTLKECQSEPCRGLTQVSTGLFSWQSHAMLKVVYALNHSSPEHIMNGTC